MKSLSLPRPHAIIMVGIPSSGKTFFAKKFADTFHAPRVALEEITALAMSPEAAATLAERQLEELTKTNQSIVLELSTETRQSRRELTRILKDHGYTPLFVWVQTDQDTALQRSLKANSHDAESFKERLKHFSPPHASEAAVVISGKHTYATQAKVVLKRLSAPRANISQHKTPPARVISIQ